MRVRLLEAQIDGFQPSELICAVNIKEPADPASVNGAGGAQSHSPVMVQKKKTFYPQWGRCFDAHVYPGRVMQIIVMDGQETPRAQVTLTLEELSDECKREPDPTNAILLQVRTKSSSPCPVTRTML